MEFLSFMKLARNFGQTPAMQAGFDHAKGEIIVTLDGDLQNDPEDIAGLLTEMKNGYDVVCGWRKQREGKAFSRILPSKIANWLIRMITGVPIHDNGCSLKAYKCSVIKSIRLYSYMHQFIPPMSTMVGARITEIVVNHRSRKHGESKYAIPRISKVFFDIITIKMLIQFYDKPLFLFSIFGMFLTFLGVVAGFTSIIQLSKENHTIIFSGASFLLFFLSGSLFLWGLLAEFMVKMETKRSLKEEKNENSGIDIKKR
jgi:glycosyltransferase involved in cell wall biosynthesis